MDKATHTKGPWHVVPYGDGNSLVICTEPDGNCRICFLATPGDSSGAWETIKADARLIAAAPELYSLASNFEVTGPDADGLVWLVLHGNGTTGRAMVNLGTPDRLVVQVALHLEQDRKAALSKAGGPNVG